MTTTEGNEGIKQGNDDERYGQRLVPMVTDDSVDGKQAFHTEVGHADDHNVKADNDKRADRQVDNEPWRMAVEQLRSTEYAKQEHNVEGIE